MANLNDYLDSLSPEETAAFHNGPQAQIAARGRPYTDGLSADLVYSAPAPTSSTMFAPAQMTASGSAPVQTVMPVSTVPVPVGEWRRMVSMAALELANIVTAALRASPTSPVRNVLTPLRTFGLVVLDPSRMTLAAARSTITGLTALVSTESAFRAIGAWEARAGLSRIYAMLPVADSSTGTPSGEPWTPTGIRPPTGGGGGITSDGTAPPSTSAPGGSPPGPSGPTTSGCPVNASLVTGGCACDPGFMPDASMTSCIPISSGGGGSATPGPGPTSASTGGGLGWLLLLGGAALAFKAMK